MCLWGSFGKACEPICSPAELDYFLCCMLYSRLLRLRKKTSFANPHLEMVLYCNMTRSTSLAVLHLFEFSITSSSTPTAERVQRARSYGLTL